MRSYIYALVLMMHSSIYSQNITDELLLHYPFDANYEDVSGNNYHGVNINTLFVEDRFGVQNVATFFDENACVELPNESELKPDFPFSVAMWFKNDDLASGNINSYSLWSSDQKNNTYAGAFLTLLRSTGQLLIGYGADQSCIDVICRYGAISVDSFNSDQWYHIAVNFVSEQEIELYINGCLRDLEVSGTGLQSMVYSDIPGAIGKNDHSSIFGNPVSYYKGSIDEFYFWSRSISEEEVKWLVNKFFDSEPEYIYTSLCPGESVIYNGIEYFNPGQYEIVETNLFGCDSISILSIQSETCNDCDVASDQERLKVKIKKVSENQYFVLLGINSVKMMDLDTLKTTLLKLGLGKRSGQLDRSARLKSMERQLDQLIDLKNNKVISLDLRIEK